MKIIKSILIFAICFIAMFTLIAHTKEPADSLKRVMDSGVFTVAGFGGYPPFNYIEDGKVVGFDVEVGEEIAKRMGVDYKYVMDDWKKLIGDLDNRRFDAILASIAVTEERLKLVDFTDPYSYSGAQLFVRKDSGIYSAEQMKGKTIGVGRGSTYVNDAEKLGGILRYYSNANESIKALINGEIDGVVTDRFVGLAAMEKFDGGDQIAIVDSLLRLEKIAVVVKKGDKELQNRINEILKEMHEDGTLKNLSEKWFNKVNITVP